MTRWMLTRVTRPVSGAKPTRLTLNTLEERVVPAIHTWSNAGATHNWSESGNWAGSSPPTTGEAGGTIVVLPINDPLMIQDIAGLVVQRVNFTNTGVATLTMTTPLGIDSTSLNLGLVSSGTNTITGSSLNLVGATVPVSVDAGTLTVVSQVTGSQGFRKLGPNALTLAGSVANTYTGTTTVENGVLALNNNATSGAVALTLVVGDGVGAAGSAVVRLLQNSEIPDAAAVTVRSDGQLDLNGFNDAIGLLTLQGGSGVATGTGTLGLTDNVVVAATGAGTPAVVSGKLDLGSAARTFTVADGPSVIDLAVSAVISGTAGLVKAGPGAMVVTAANTYTGATVVNAGLLKIDGVQAGSPVTLTGGTVGGAGTVGALTATGGTVAPGSGVATAPVTFSTGDLVLGAATYAPLISGTPGGAADKVAVTGTVNLTGSTLAPVLVGTPTAAGQTIVILTNDGNDPVVGTFAGLAPGATLTVSGQAFTVSYTAGDGNDVALTRTAAPVIPNTAPTISDVPNQPASANGVAVGPLSFTVGDAETAPAALAVTAASSNPAFVVTLGGTGAARTVTVTPVAGQSGTATITLTVTDAGGLTATDTFTVTVNPAVVVTPGNTAPTVSAVANQTTAVGVAVGPLSFTVGDAETAPAVLAVTAASSNPAFVVTLGGTSATRTVTVTPAAGQSGTATVTLTVTDAGGLTATTAFTVTAAPVVIPPPPIPVGTPVLVGVPLFAVGTDAGTRATATLYNADKSVRFAASPFGDFSGGVRVATGDFNGDGVADLVVGTGPGRATQVVVLDGVTQKVLFTIDPFEASFTGGVYVAAGDVNGDGVADLIITPDQGGGPRVRAFAGNKAGTPFAQYADFFGIDDKAFFGGARAAVADFNGDGVGDLVVAAGFGGGPRVATFNGLTLGQATPVKLFGDFLAFEADLRNGAFVAAGDLDGDGRAELIAGGGPGGGPRVTAFSGQSLLSNQQVPLANFFAGDVTSRGGIRVAVKNLDGDARADLVVGAGTAAGSRVTAYAGKSVAAASPTELYNFDAVAGFSGGVFVG